VGIAPQLSDAELVTLAMMQAMFVFTSEARWLRHADAHLRHLFPYLPKQPGCNKRLRKAAELILEVSRTLARDIQLWSDDAWVVDSTPIECGRSARPSSAPSSPDGPSTGTAQATRATSGDCGCTWCAPCTAALSPPP
jgi:hypothetical protein